MEVKKTALPLDCGQIKKAAQALLAYNASKRNSGEKVLLNVDQNVFLMVTVWKIPPREQMIKITLPHSVLPAASEICLFTKDEPGLTAEQTENLYKKLLVQHGITSITEVIPYKMLKTDYKPFEAKRRLLSRCALFLSDDRIRRMLPSHLGKSFYQRKKAPLSVNLRAKNLAKEIEQHTQGTLFPVTNKGCCYSVRVGHTSMEASEIMENVMALSQVMASKASQIWKSVKILHLRTDSSVALPVYNSAGPVVAAVRKQNAEITQKRLDPSSVSQNIPNKTTQKKKKKRTKKTVSEQTETASEIPELVKPEAEEEEEIPQLVPIEASPQVEKQQVAAPSSVSRKELETDSPTVLGKRKRALLGKTPSRQPKTSGDALNVETSKPKTPKNPQHPSAKPAVTPKTVKPSKSAKKPPQPTRRGPRRMKAPLSV